MKFTTLDSIVRDICSLLGDTNNEQYIRVARVAADAIEQMNLVAFPNIKSDVFTISDNLTVAMPEDCVAIIRVGFIDNRGMIYVMDRDDRIRRVDKYQYENQGCEPEKQVPQVGTFVDPYAYPFLNLSSRYEYIGERYGVSTRQSLMGVYRYNNSMNVIEFGDGSMVAPGVDIVVEYKTTLGDDIHKMIPSEFKIAIQYRAMSLLTAMTNPSLSRSNYDMFLREYRTAKGIFARKSYSLQDLTNVVLEATRSAKY